MLALAWEASYQVWRARCESTDTRSMRAIWADAPLAVRVRQAERWLGLAERERKRQRTMAARSARKEPNTREA